MLPPERGQSDTSCNRVSLASNMPKRKAADDARQPGWPDSVKTEAGIKARNDALKRKQPSYEVEYTTASTKVAKKTFYFASGKMPVAMARAVDPTGTARHAERPSAKMYKAGVRSHLGVEDLCCGGFAGSTDSWSSDQPMPDEPNQCDVGWQPGPIDRPVPEFKGPPRGPTNAAIDHTWTPQEIMNSELLTDDFCDLLAKHAIGHCKAYRKEKKLETAKQLKASKNRVEKAMGLRLAHVDKELVRLWIAA